MAGRCVVLELCPYSGVSRGLITVASQSVSRVVGQRRAIVPHSTTQSYTDYSGNIIMSRGGDRQQ